MPPPLLTPAPAKCTPVAAADADPAVPTTMVPSSEHVPAIVARTVQTRRMTFLPFGRGLRADSSTGAVTGSTEIRGGYPARRRGRQHPPADGLGHDADGQILHAALGGLRLASGQGEHRVAGVAGVGRTNGRRDALVR